MRGEIIAVCTSDRKGERKTDRGRGMLVQNFGLAGDAHGGDWHRQVSLLAEESIDKMRARGLALANGDFAENLTTRGIIVHELPVGTRLRIGQQALAEVTQIGKECHTGCAIRQQTGDCVMPREGIFARVLRGGEVAAGDVIETANFFTVGVITLSDKGSRGERVDESGRVIEDLVRGAGGEPCAYSLLPDEPEQLKQELIRFADSLHLDVILTTGGTGLTPRDQTPEATLAVIDREIPGMAEAMRAYSLTKTPRAMLSRAVAGARGKSLIVNLPGSPKAVRENLEVLLPVLPHAVETLRGVSGDCGPTSSSHR
ncbi:MAG: molybdenum cofactor synthesis domain-containing protein [Chloroflexota bacterium]